MKPEAFVGEARVRARQTIGKSETGLVLAGTLGTVVALGRYGDGGPRVLVTRWDTVLVNGEAVALPAAVTTTLRCHRAAVRHGIEVESSPDAVESVQFNFRATARTDSPPLPDGPVSPKPQESQPIS